MCVCTLEPHRETRRALALFVLPLLPSVSVLEKYSGRLGVTAYCVATACAVWLPRLTPQTSKKQGTRFEFVHEVVQAICHEWESERGCLIYPGHN